ncbi:MAG: hypothetical protein LQ350_004966 [Teloschistes chrysophthalmus]|nr:MAG: hypothetical protein LQ350_004966 [Niorma chrysophthalma]
MTSLFYNRYVPPTASKVPSLVKNELEDTRQSKKRRKQNDTNTTEVNAIKDSSQSTSGHSGKERPSILMTKVERKAEKKARKSISDPNQVIHSSHESTIHESTAQVEAPSEPVVKKKTSKKPKRTGEMLKPDPAIITEDAEPSKHSKILSKYERSIKAPTTPTEITKDENESQNRDIPPPPETHDLVPIPQPPQVPDAALPSAFSALPTWLREPTRVSEAETLSFDQLHLSPSIIATLKSKGYKEAFAIQAAVLPLLLPGQKQHDGDLCIAASTGSGKTLAYALPMIEALHDMPITRLRGLVVVPTRELVSQARKTFETCSLGTGLKIGTAFGSKPLKEEQEALISCHQQYNPEAYQLEQEHKKALDEDEQLLNWHDDELEEHNSSRPELTGYINDYVSNVDILICTPGRLIEHMRHTRGFNLDHVQWLVIDEADRLLDEDSQQWVDIVIPALEHQKPLTNLESERLRRFHILHKRDVRKIILSATMTRDVSKLQDLKLRRPKLVTLENRPGKGVAGDSDTGSLEPEVDLGGQVELPSKLQENAVQIKDVQNKPLYLIELLKGLSLLQPNGTGPRPEKPEDDTSESDTDETSDDASTSSDETSSISSSSDSNPTSSSSSPPAHRTPKTSCPSPQQRKPTCLIFTHSTESAHRLSRLLFLLSPLLASTTATLTKSSTNNNKSLLTRLQSGTLITLISTDRASRGLDIQNLAHVINYDMPPSVDSYVHRVGRTARAGNGGMATTLVGWTEGRWFWNEIARGGRIRRGGGGDGGKVARVKVREQGWGEGELEAYADALKKVGEEARGKGR